MRGSHGRDDAASIPIFAMSANAFVEDRQAAKEAGQPGVHLRPDPRGRAYRKAD